MKIKISIPSDRIDKMCLSLMMNSYAIQYETTGNFYIVKKHLNIPDRIEYLMKYLNRQKLDWIEK